jgi:uncharacterized membrane protein YdbT with pleckstrin-like domain
VPARKGANVRYPERLLTPDEQIIHQFRPHWKVLLPAFGWALLFAVLVGVAFAALQDRENWMPWTVLGIAVLLWLVLSAKALLDWVFTNYVLTSERIIVRKGMIARSGTEIPLENINNVLFSQRVLERLLGYGDVIVESAGSMGQSVLDNIPDPEAFQSEVYATRELRSLQLKGGTVQTRDVVEQLEALADLRERGHLTDEEFAAKKRQLLGQVTAGPPDVIVGDTRIEPVEPGTAATGDELDPHER